MILRSGVEQPDTGRRYYQAVSEYTDEEPTTGAAVQRLGGDAGEERSDTEEGNDCRFDLDCIIAVNKKQDKAAGFGSAFNQEGKELALRIQGTHRHRPGYRVRASSGDDAGQHERCSRDQSAYVRR